MAQLLFQALFGVQAGCEAIPPAFNKTRTKGYGARYLEMIPGTDCALCNDAEVRPETLRHAGVHLHVPPTAERPSDRGVTVGKAVHESVLVSKPVFQEHNHCFRHFFHRNSARYI